MYANQGSMFFRKFRNYEMGKLIFWRSISLKPISQIISLLKMTNAMKASKWKYLLALIEFLKEILVIDYYIWKN